MVGIGGTGSADEVGSRRTGAFVSKSFGSIMFCGSFYVIKLKLNCTRPRTFAKMWWARWDLNPQAFWARHFKCRAYTNSATRPSVLTGHLEAPTGVAPVYTVLQTVA